MGKFQVQVRLTMQRWCVPMDFKVRLVNRGATSSFATTVELEEVNLKDAFK